ncbi:MAG: O-antigen ligase family protein [Acidipropionibacterium sp.]|nr:O-antigen ligase family protein [Acidipropionibacterium sp.]
MRLPLSFIALLVVPWFMIIARVVRGRSGPTCKPLFALLAWCLFASVLSVGLLHRDSLFSTGNNAAIMTAVIGYTWVMYRSEYPGLAARRTLEGLYWGAVAVWLMGIGEMVTGVKLLPILYPGANTAGAVSSSRFVVSATYPNYNDFCVVLTMLFTGVLARMWFQPVRGLRNAGRWVILLTTMFMVVVMGSRGALLGCVVAFALLVILNIRRLHRAAMGVRAGLLGGALVIVAGIALFSSSYVQDHSTAQRGAILGNALTMLMGSPADALLGYGSLVDYQAAAAAAYGNILMDPHNLLLELWLRYGVLALVLFIAVWLWVLVRGYLPRTPMVGWHTAFGLVVVVLMPVLGVVPSSTLRYHVTWLYLAATCLLVAQMRPASGGSEGSGSETAPGTAQLQAGHHEQADHDAGHDVDHRGAEQLRR